MKIPLENHDTLFLIRGANKMATVNIIIKGIAMTYHKENGLWKILFPFGDCHELKFKEGFSDPGIALAEADRQIRIITENARSEFEIDGNYNDFLDLTADYSHANGVSLKNDWSENAVLMTIENAKLAVYEYTESEHMITDGNSVTLAPTIIGYSAQATIDSESITIEVDNHPLFPKTFDSDCTLIFDNDCELGETREISDFDLVYNVVEDVAATAQRFVVTKIAEDIDFPIVAGTVLNGENGKRIRDPFTRGLPCHLVRVSKPENLL